MEMCEGAWRHYEGIPGVPVGSIGYECRLCGAVNWTVARYPDFPPHRHGIGRMEPRNLYDPIPLTPEEEERSIRAVERLLGRDIPCT